MSKRIEDIEDEDELRNMMKQTENPAERKKIRARMSEVANAQAAQRAAERAALAGAREDPIAMKHRQAEEARKKKQDLQADLEKNRKLVTSGEDYKKQKYAEAEAEKQKKIDEMNKIGGEMHKMYNMDTTALHDEAKKN